MNKIPDKRLTESRALFSKLEKSITKYLCLDGDEGCLALIVSLLLSVKMEGDPIWGIIVSPPSGGKTEILRIFQSTLTIFIDSITPATLVSGYRDKKNKKHDPSLILKLHNKCLVIKDLTLILKERVETRNKIFSQLRCLYDGLFSAGTGITTNVDYNNIRFGCICACTPIIDKYYVAISELGERFLYLRLTINRTKAAMMAAKNRRDQEAIRKRLNNAGKKFLREIDIGIDKEVQGHTEQEFYMLAEFIAHCRIHIERDRSRKNITIVNEAELPSRLLTCFIRLYSILFQLVPSAKASHFIKRIVFDTIPKQRATIIKFLYRKGKATVEDITKHMGVSKGTVKNLLDELKLKQLRIVKYTVDKTYKLTPVVKKILDSFE